MAGSCKLWRVVTDGVKLEPHTRLDLHGPQFLYWIETKILIHMYLTDTHINC